MEREAGMESLGGKTVSDEGVFGEEEGTRGSAARPGPTWRALAVSIIVAVALSVMATLLLDGSFRLKGNAVGAGCGSGGACCPLPAEEGK